MQKVSVKPIMTVEEADAMSGKFISDDNIKKVLTEDVTVVDKESGQVIAILVKGVIPGQVQQQTFNALLKAAGVTNARPNASGEPKGHHRILKNGRKSRVIYNAPVNSGIVGYYERTIRFPYCRMTAFTGKHFDKFKEAYPMIGLVDQYYSGLRPKEYKKQRKVADSTSPQFRIPNTAFTTITVNKNYRTAVHKDAGDFKEGFGNLVAMRKGYFEGGILCLIRWGVGFDLQNGDLLLMDVHQWHANTPLKLVNPNAVRLSLVMYYRENMVKCGTAEQELKKVKNRKKGDRL